MQTIDWLILAVYLCGLTGIGIYFSRRQSSLSEFLKGGERVGWLAVGVSLMAALNSGMDYIQTPAIVFVFGMVYVSLILTWIPLYPWVTRVTLPFYRRLKVISAYEYLERRFGCGVRLTASTIFVLWRISWMGVALYVPCLAIKGATGNQLDVTGMAVVLGGVVTLYTMLGGMKAVIWSDVLQFCAMFGGLFATLAFIVSSVPGGAAEVWTTAYDAGRISFAAQIPGWSELDGPEKLFRYLTTEVTFGGTIVFILLGRMATYTSDQVAVQRFQTVGSYQEARRVFLVSALADVVWMVVLGGVGLALFAYANVHPLPEGLKNDLILPYFMSQNFPAGLTGVVVASVLAASLSSVDSALNATTSVIMIDFYNRLWLGRGGPIVPQSAGEERRQVLVSRCATLGLGVAMTMVAATVEQMGEIYTIGNKLFGAFFGIIFGTFALGMFSRRASSGGVVLGALAGLAVSCFFAFFSELSALHEPFRAALGSRCLELCQQLSWQWPPLLGIVTTLCVGRLASQLLPGARPAAEPLTYWEVLRLPDGENDADGHGGAAGRGG